ncbi:DNA-processing protein DprA [Parvularcula sp. LCG005]|nr:DNA-processing protein DprA [Parvularcula sp. LCG005]WOI52309.1 DNA-processing protein DprA [Parvularcula sp. LCG005]
MAPEGLAEREAEAVAKAGASILIATDPDYPRPLAAIPDPPPVITVLGEVAHLSRDGVGIVGARNASAVGRRMASTLARELGEAGYVINSGLARGIDGAAHHAALQTGTVAVLAGGVDQIYPPEHRDLYTEIIDHGAIVSEVPFGMVARARDFPKRNRIVSGLSKGVIVVEAADRSGTLITARLALEQGREVFAIPGSPLDPRCEGTNRLIRNGAILTRHTDDVLEGLQTLPGIREPDRTHYTAAPLPDAAPSDRRIWRRQIVELLGYTPVTRDVLIRETDIPPAYIADILLDLVLDGKVDEAPGGFTLSTSDN